MEPLNEHNSKQKILIKALVGDIIVYDISPRDLLIHCSCDVYLLILKLIKFCKFLIFLSQNICLLSIYSRWQKWQTICQKYTQVQWFDMQQ